MVFTIYLFKFLPPLKSASKEMLCQNLSQMFGLPVAVLTYESKHAKKACPMGAVAILRKGRTPRADFPRVQSS